MKVKALRFAAAIGLTVLALWEKDVSDQEAKRAKSIDDLFKDEDKNGAAVEKKE